MNIYAKPGDKIIYAFPKNGREVDQALADKWLKLGDVYTVEAIERNLSFTTVYLEKLPNLRFNSSLFEDYFETKITIKNHLTDLNAYIAAINRNRLAGNRIKQKETYVVRHAFLQKIDEFKNLKLPIALDIIWFCKDKRKDKDNIAFAIKFILDGMIAAGVIKNDGWSEISGFSHHFEVDKKRPRIEITVRNEPDV
ncbi:RusA family crossover junction endodeoxyribonuclease [Enterococcus sp. DIV0800]|uniref:RusA family crossover junction endodeoxyribonuclease n=1 Tax=unclassified Enterococcus TaxID=2608891 RepID=UPI003D2FC0E2